MPDEARRLVAGGEFDPEQKSGHGDTENELIVRWLTANPHLARRLLTWCNTPMFNVSRPYESVAAAAALMDSQELVHVTIVAAARDFFAPENRIDIYSRSRLWSHSAAVGSVASMISRTCGLGQPSLAFVAGALHDIGLLASERLSPASFASVVMQIDELSSMPQVESEAWGWNHAQLGAKIVEQWGLPDSVQSAVEHHHAPDAASENPHHKLISVVALANFLCSRSGWSSLGIHNLRPPSQKTLQTLDIDADLLTVLWQQIPAAIEAAKYLK